MKSYSNSTLTNDDLLCDAKRHAGQLEFILRECKARGIQTNASAIISTYLTLATTLRFAPDKGDAARRAAERINDYMAWSVVEAQRGRLTSAAEEIAHVASIIEAELGEAQQ